MRKDVFGKGEVTKEQSQAAVGKPKSFADRGWRSQGLSYRSGFLINVGRQPTTPLCLSICSLINGSPFQGSPDTTAAHIHNSTRQCKGGNCFQVKPSFLTTLDV